MNDLVAEFTIYDEITQKNLGSTKVPVENLLSKSSLGKNTWVFVDLQDDIAPQGETKKKDAIAYIHLQTLIKG